MYRAFSPTNANVRSFDAIVLPFRLVMPGGEAEFAEGCAIDPPFVRYQDSRSEFVLLQKLAHPLQRRPLVAPRLNQDADHLTVLVDRRPRIHPAAANRDVHLAQIPLRVCPPTPSSRTSSDRWTQPHYPSSNDLVRHFNTPFSHEVLDVVEAQIEPSIQRDSALDDR